MSDDSKPDPELADLVDRLAARVDALEMRVRQMERDAKRATEPATPAPYVGLRPLFPKR